MAATDGDDSGFVAHLRPRLGEMLASGKCCDGTAGSVCSCRLRWVPAPARAPPTPTQELLFRSLPPLREFAARAARPAGYDVVLDRQPSTVVTVAPGQVVRAVVTAVSAIGFACQLDSVASCSASGRRTLAPLNAAVRACCNPTFTTFTMQPRRRSNLALCAELCPPGPAPARGAVCRHGGCGRVAGR